MAGLTGIPALLVSIATTATIFAILSLGLNLHWGYTGLFNISVAAFWAIGAYTATLVTKPASADTAFGFDLPYFWIEVFGLPIPFPVALFAAALTCAIVAVLIGIPTLRLRDDYLAIATLGLAETIRLILLNERWLSEGGMGTSVDNPLTSLPYNNLLLLVIGLLLLGFFYWMLERGIDSPWGRVLQGIREDEDVTNSLGKNTFWFKMQSFVIGSVIMGIAGTLTALQLNFLIPEQFNPAWSFFVWIAVLLGGSGSNQGAILGGVALALLFELPRYLGWLIPFGGSNTRLLIMGILILLVMTYAPEGLLGESKPQSV